MVQSKKFLQSKKSKREIIEATIGLLAMKGYGQTSISDISAATGLTKGALYHHFSSKDDLFEVTFRFIADIYEGKLTELDSGQTSPVYQLSEFFDMVIDLIEEHDDFMLIACSLVLELDGEKSSFARPIIDVIGEYTTFVERIIEKGQAIREFTTDMDPKLLSLNIIGQLFGNTIPWILNRDKTNYRVIVTSQKEMTLKALNQ
jgi:AcrR family transcriptional regulator